MEKRTDYAAKTKFLAEFEQWRLKAGLTHREVARNLDLKSSANLSLWVKPLYEGKPFIGLDKIKKMSKLSGILFISSDKIEMQNYLELKV